MLDSPLVQFIVFGLAVMGFFILIKFSVNLLPDSGVLGDVRRVILTA